MIFEHIVVIAKHVAFDLALTENACAANQERKNN